jgi:hypothetical protein
MVRTCSRDTRCRARTQNIILTDDNFRKGSNPPQSDEYFRWCNFCRGKNVVIPTRRRRLSNGNFYRCYESLI